MTTLADLRVVADLLDERTRQDAKWGEQNHDDFIWGAILSEEVGEAAQASLQHYFSNDGPDVSADRVAEEVTQCAAVAVGWRSAIDRHAPRRERVYLSGPISGIPDAAHRFQEAADALDPQWFEAVNPFNVAPLSHPGVECGRGYHPGDNEHGHTSSACYMRTDLMALLSCDSIRMLPGWEDSRGAQVELMVAKACGMGITYSERAAA